MTAERYLIRQDDGGPDLVWIAEIEFDRGAGTGRLSYHGALEGDGYRINGGGQLAAELESYRERGMRVDRI